jgi:hypothetical protein
MSTNRNLLKEAIADAKTVKETAIANAKAVLEESFAPQLKSMISLKLQEMADEDENEMLDEEGFGPGSNLKGDEGFSSMGEKALDEEDEMIDEDMDLEDLLKELNEEKEEMESEEEIESEDEMESEEGEPLDLEDMTDEDLKNMIEDVIKDMIKDGELEAGNEGMEDEKEIEDEMEDEEVNLEELLREIDNLDEEDMYDEGMMYEEDEDMMAEGIMDKIVGFVNRLGSSGEVEDKMKELPSKIMAFKRLGKLDSSYTPSDAELAELTKQAKADGGLGAFQPKDKKVVYIPSKDLKSQGVTSTFSEELKKELDEAYATIKTLRKDLNEVNLLNAKLLYTNKIFKSKNLNENQKVKVLNSFDKATTVNEVKLVFETLNEGLKVKTTKLNENLGSASKVLHTPKKQPIVESNDMVARFQKLAGII